MKSILLILTSIFANKLAYADVDLSKYIQAQYQKMYVDLAVAAVEEKHGSKMLCQDISLEENVEEYIVVKIDCGPGYAEIQEIEAASYRAKVFKRGKGEGDVTYVHRIK